MSEQTGISWTDHTFNPWWGCQKVSPACDHCYAERDSKRFAPKMTLWGVDAERRTFGEKHWNEPRRWNAKAAKDGTRRRVFCASMADVFDKNAPEGDRARLWRLIHETPRLDWLLLTKRIGNAWKMLPPEWVDSLVPRMPDNVWLGATVIDQAEADRDLPKLLKLPARIRFVSIEPMLGPIEVFSRMTGELLHTSGDDFDPGAIDWLISGGESGPHARPAHPDWFRSLRDQCAAAGVPFHFKQHGEWGPEINGYPVRDSHRWPAAGDGRVVMSYRVGKATAGRLLDGVEHNGFPRDVCFLGERMVDGAAA